MRFERKKDHVRERERDTSMYLESPRIYVISSQTHLRNASHTIRITQMRMIRNLTNCIFTIHIPYVTMFYHTVEHYYVHGLSEPTLSCIIVTLSRRDVPKGKGNCKDIPKSCYKVHWSHQYTLWRTKATNTQCE